ERPFEVLTRFDLGRLLEIPGTGAFTIPLGVPNPFGIVASGVPSQNARRLPMACLAQTNTETLTMRMPSGVEVVRLPENVSIENELGSYKATYSINEQVVHVLRELVLFPDGPICGVGEAAKLR